MRFSSFCPIATVTVAPLLDTIRTQLPPRSMLLTEHKLGLSKGERAEVSKSLLFHTTSHHPFVLFLGCSGGGNILLKMGGVFLQLPTHLQFKNVHKKHHLVNQDGHFDQPSRMYIRQICRNIRVYYEMCSTVHTIFTKAIFVQRPVCRLPVAFGIQAPKKTLSAVHDAKVTPTSSLSRFSPGSHVLLQSMYSPP